MEDWEREVAARDYFWEALGHITATALSMVDAAERDTLLMQLQDSCSVYGTKYEEYLSEIEKTKTENGKCL